MNLIARLTCAAGIAALPVLIQAATPASQSDDRETPAPEHSLRDLVDGPKGHPGQDLFHRKAGPREKESVTFLGVETAPVSETLIAQLALPDNAGLVVVNVVPDSPAAGTLRPHDILLKLDDQILIDQRQLSVLIRNHKPGDEVTVTYMRTGKSATAKLKLVTHEVPKFSEIIRPAFPGFDLKKNAGGGFQFGSEGHEDVNRVLSLIDDDPKAVVRMGAHGPEGAIRVTKVLPDNSNMVMSDQEGSLELTIKNGQKTLVAKDAKGVQVFSGPANTPEQQAAMPPAVRERFEKLQSMDRVKFRTDSDFEGGKTNIYEPAGKTIMLRRVHSESESSLVL